MSFRHGCTLENSVDRSDDVAGDNKACSSVRLDGRNESSSYSRYLMSDREKVLFTITVSHVYSQSR